MDCLRSLTRTATFRWRLTTRKNGSTAYSSPRLLYAALGIALNRLEHLASHLASGYSGVIDRRILQQGHAALIDARPSPGTVAELRRRDRQLDLFGTAG